MPVSFLHCSATPASSAWPPASTRTFTVPAALPDVGAGPPAPQAVAARRTAVDRPPMAVIREIVVREDIAVDSLSFEGKYGLLGLGHLKTGEKPFCQIVMARH